jgi:hypothetical protein
MRDLAVLAITVQMGKRHQELEKLDQFQIVTVLRRGTVNPVLPGASVYLACAAVADVAVQEASPQGARRAIRTGIARHAARITTCRVRSATPSQQMAIPVRQAPRASVGIVAVADAAVQKASPQGARRAIRTGIARHAARITTCRVRSATPSQHLAIRVRQAPCASWGIVAVADAVVQMASPQGAWRATHLGTAPIATVLGTLSQAPLAREAPPQVALLALPAPQRRPAAPLSTPARMAPAGRFPA